MDVVQEGMSVFRLRASPSFVGDHQGVARPVAPQEGELFAIPRVRPGFYPTYKGDAIPETATSAVGS